uniref:Uncharacterized protein n=1 Tax=Oryza punctata TaxID=4537 RepID=A0A0E0K096_ORYPU
MENEQEKKKRKKLQTKQNSSNQSEITWEKPEGKRKSIPGDLTRKESTDINNLQNQEGEGSNGKTLQLVQ